MLSGFPGFDSRRPNRDLGDATGKFCQDRPTRLAIIKGRADEAGEAVESKEADCKPYENPVCVSALVMIMCFERRTWHSERWTGCDRRQPRGSR